MNRHEDFCINDLCPTCYPKEYQAWRDKRIDSLKIYEDWELKEALEYRESTRKENKKQRILQEIETLKQELKDCE